MSSDQKEHLQAVLGLLVQMYRSDDQSEAFKCIATQGGLDACALAFYSDEDLGDDGVWDNWRLEGPVVCLALSRCSARSRLGAFGR